MVMRKSNSAEIGTSSVTFPFGPPEGFNLAVSDALSRNRHVIENTIRTLNAEAMSFIGKRFEHTGQAIEECQDCKTFPEILSVQQKWATEAMREYMAESLRLGETLQTLLAESAGLHSPASSKDNAPKRTGKEFAAEPARVHA
jgi:hypothetical protein